MKEATMIVDETLRNKCRAAFQFAEKQVRHLIETYPDYFPMYTENGKWKHGGEAWTNWCEGFLGGQLWLIYAQNGDPWWREQAEHYSRLIEHRKTDRNVHDLGFLFWSTWKRWYDLTGAPEVNAVVIEAGQTLALRFKEKGQYLRSFVADESLFIDIMMNVGIIFYAAQQTGDDDLLAHRDPALPDDAPLPGARRWQHVARRHLRHGNRRISCARAPTRAGATIRRGRAGWPGRFTALARSTASPGTRASCRPPKPAPTTTSSTRPSTAFRPTTGWNRLPARPYESSAAAIAASGLFEPARP